MANEKVASVASFLFDFLVILLMVSIYKLSKLINYCLIRAKDYSFVKRFIIFKAFLLRRTLFFELSGS